MKLAEGFEAYANGERCHEAGYDAFLTGVAHASLMAQGHACPSRLNLCYLMRSLLILNLGGENPLNESGAVVHLTFDSGTSAKDLVELFAPLLPPAEAEISSGKPGGRSVSIFWIHETSALAALPEGVTSSEMAAVAATQAGTHRNVTAIPYRAWLSACDF